MGLSVTTFAQKDKQLKIRKSVLSTEKKKDTTEVYSLSPKLNSHTVPENFRYLMPKWKIYPDTIQEGTDIPAAKYPAMEFRMPVLGGAFSLHIPTMVPDSNIRYYIMEKRIEYYNPLERNPRKNTLTNQKPVPGKKR